MTRHLPLLAACAAAVVSLAACSSAQDAAPAAAPADSPASASQGVTMASTSEQTPVIIDVRTPEEFAEGHLEGAINIDIRSADFEARLHELNPMGSYAVYCRSGNRSGQAVQIMMDHAFTNVTNVGSREQASEALGVPIVR